MVVQAGAAEQVLDHDPAQARAALQAIGDAGRQARLELRRLLGLLRAEGEEAELAPQPGLAELPALADELRASGLEVELDVEPGPVPPGLGLAAYRIVQEALTNALKHGGPGRATVHVRLGGDALEVDVHNRGTGAATNGAGGLGLVGMGERIALYGGELEHGPAGDGSYRLKARLPR
jgi:signal transduction histidine kinase